MTTFSVLSLPVLRSLHVEHVFKRIVVLRICKVHVGSEVWLLSGQCPVNTRQDSKRVGLTHESEILSNVCHVTATLGPMGSEVWLLFRRCTVNRRQDSKYIGLTHESEISSNVCHKRADGKFQFGFQVFHGCYPWQELGGLDKNSNPVHVRSIVK